MSRKIAINNLNATTLDILNVIRANASSEYRDLVPKVTQEKDIPVVGDILLGHPALANQFLNALMNRIAVVRAKSAFFNNPYKELKKGFLEYGETIEEVFVNIVKAREFSVEKAEEREFKRSLPDVRAAFHVMNFRCQYPITIQEYDLHQAFLDADGVTGLIAQMLQAPYTSAEYDEFLIFKYLIIKGVTKGLMKPVNAGANTNTAAKAFRGTSNKLLFMSPDYNQSGVHTVTPRDDQYIFMSADYNAEFDVDQLASAFNMDKTNFFGHLKLIDDFTTFDNDRFSDIIEGSTQIELVTDAELALMADVKAVLVDAEYFQVYDNHFRMSQKEVASGEYWNYFLNVWKTVSYSPFSNAVVFVDGTANIDLPANITVSLDSIAKDSQHTTYAFNVVEPTALIGGVCEFIQTEALTRAGIAVQKYGAVIAPNGTEGIVLTAKIGTKLYTATVDLSAVEVGASVTLAGA